MEFLECGGNGDCLFHVQAYALSLLLNKSISMNDVRDGLAKTLNENNIQSFIQDVLNENPSNIKPRSLTEIQALIRKNGYDFIGTDKVVEWQTKHQFANLHMGILIITKFGKDFNPVFETKTTCFYMMIYHVPNQSHWQLVKFQKFHFISKTLVHLLYNN